MRGTDAVTRLRASISDWRTLRGDIEFLDEKATWLASGCVDYDCALFDPSGGALNPLAYARFLAQESERRGAAVCSATALSSTCRVTVKAGGSGRRADHFAARVVVRPSPGRLARQRSAHSVTGGESAALQVS